MPFVNCFYDIQFYYLREYQFIGLYWGKLYHTQLRKAIRAAAAAVVRFRVGSASRAKVYFESPPPKAA